ncbi:NACHT domain-containing protein [Limnoraphis robusta]|uniref:NACHT domain-containing protein n=1 Tax=Limnoraphis robusta TaxID=1118279 RepID=UPI002B1EC454|nr:NACHT domain-containing NTPase [Limnoraphis robusta]MEA5500671.1 NACHT domain-containing NTPase [Limnoraphis robusta BA-68 BA1]
MGFPKDFLEKLADEKELTDKEKEVFLPLFGDDLSRIQITLQLNISEGSLKERLRGIYTRFQIGGNGPGKESRLKSDLNKRYQRWQAENSNSSLLTENTDVSIQTLVKKTRLQIKPYIQECCGTMRVLDMTQPIKLGKIYTNVNILEKITGKTWREIAQLQEKVSRENFERWCRGTVKEERIPGIEAAEKFSKLMILGKPGAGKTTFLKHLAIQCIGGAFQAERVPVFITLKDFADIKEHPNLLEYLQNLLKRYSDEMEDIVTLSSLLKAGKFLILLDGLDEVREIDSSRILREIKQLSQQFPQNQFVITCRIAAKEYTFEKFTDVEVADFNEEQIADFSQKWFHSKNDPVKAERFLEKLKQDEPILELATNPLLLTLLCLVFEDAGSFPSNRADLYKNGLDVLLTKWDANRNIERDQVYKGLSLKRKEDLLSRIAHTTFQAGDYIFKTREIEGYISEYIQNLRNAKTDPKALELDSEAVLKSIEAQHGLLVERARNIYSFSHLTFHEYLTARKIVTNCNQDDINDPTLRELVSHITEPNWREVFLLTVQMLGSADCFLLNLKSSIDLLVENSEEFQKFLLWLYHKVDSIKIRASPNLAIKIFYFCAESIYSFGIFYEAQLIEMVKEFHVDIQCEPEIDLDYELYMLHDLSDCLCFLPKDAIITSIDDICKHYTLSSDIKMKLQNLKTELNNLLREFPDPCQEPEKFQKLWASVRQKWCEDLRSLMIMWRNIGHKWDLNLAEQDLLEQYYDANLLLVECLNSDCYVSREVRQEIEETLLLPIEEIEKWKQNRQSDDRG